MLELGDLAGAEATARKGEGVLSASGDEAEWRRRAGAASAAAMLGTILDLTGDRDAGLEAHRRADAGGHGGGAFNLGIELHTRGDLHGAQAALQRAVERGAPRVEDALAEVQRQIASG